METEGSDRESLPGNSTVFLVRSCGRQDEDKEVGHRHGRSQPAQSLLKVYPSEIAFACLIESYAIAFDPLNNLVIAAVKSKHSSDWKEVLCSFFSSGVQKHINEDLDRSSCLKDIFIICKAIRWHLKGIVHYAGGQL